MSGERRRGRGRLAARGDSRMPAVTQLAGVGRRSVWRSWARIRASGVRGIGTEDQGARLTQVVYTRRGQRAEGRGQRAEGNGKRGVVRHKLRGGCARGACVDGVAGWAGIDRGAGSQAARSLGHKGGMTDGEGVSGEK